MSETRKAINDLLAQGQSIAGAARALGLSPNTVRYHRHRLEQPPSAESRTPAPPPPGAVSLVGTRAAVERWLATGSSRAEIARRLGISKATVSYHARRLGAPIDERCARRYDWSAVQAYYDAGHTVEQCAAVFGFSRYSWHAAVKRGDVVPRPAALPLQEFFARDTMRNRFHLKRRLISEGLKAPRCERCGLDSWRERPLVVSLHHRNGDRYDNRIENLEFLCPNCHSQTENFAGRNRRERAPS